MALTKSENERLTQVEGEAPMGQWLRREHWIPFAISGKLVADGAPLRVRLLGEDFVAFRATDGRVGLFDERCPHRGASLALARNEHNALRCIYHGWQFGVDGRTLDVPTQAGDKEAFCRDVPLRHYPVREGGGIAWVWLGEQGRKGATPPAFPDFEFMRSRRRTARCSSRPATSTGCRRSRPPWTRRMRACCTRATWRA